MRSTVTSTGGISALLLALAVPLPTVAQDRGVAYPDDPIRARVWLDRGERPVVDRGDRLRLYYRTAADAYVAVFHIDTDGGVRLLHPRSPAEDHYVRGGRDYRLLFSRSAYWHVDDPPGVGYFFIVASSRPLDFSRVRYAHGGGGWDLSPVGRRVYRDPYLAMDDYVAALVPGWERGWYSLHVAEYHVDRPYRYPRFLCYDCHAFRPYRSWNPYYYSCRSFRVVIYTDPVFYPVRRYGPRRVVYTGARVPDRPRFAFKERAAGEPATPAVRRRAAADEPSVQGPARRREAGAGPARRASPEAPARRPGTDRGDARSSPTGEPGRETARPRRPSGVLSQPRSSGDGARPGEVRRDRGGARPPSRDRDGARPFLQPRERDPSPPRARPPSRSPGDDSGVRARPDRPEPGTPTVRPRGRPPDAPAAGRGSPPAAPRGGQRPAVKRGGPGASGSGEAPVRPPPRKKRPPPGR